LHGYNPGSGPDILARHIAGPMAAQLGASIVVENRPGAGERLVASQVARAPADGHTLYLMTGGQTVVSATDRSLQYDLLKDFSYIGMVSVYPFAFLVSAASPYRTLADLLAAARARPDKITYSSVGVGTTLHMAVELLGSMSGVRMHHVPYKGTEAYNDLVGGLLDMSVGTLAGAQGLIRDGRLRPLCVTSPERWPGWDQVPAVAETVPGYEVVTWAALTAPAGLPVPVRTRIAAALKETLALADIRAKVEATGSLVRGNTPEEMQARSAADIAKWRRVAETARIELK
jgi:tripartite-type tricarboxylate transporter receptor subunit TctC